MTSDDVQARFGEFLNVWRLALPNTKVFEISFRIRALLTVALGQFAGCCAQRGRHNSPLQRRHAAWRTTMALKSSTLFSDSTA